MLNNLISPSVPVCVIFVVHTGHSTQERDDVESWKADIGANLWTPRYMCIALFCIASKQLYFEKHDT